MQMWLHCFCIRLSLHSTLAMASAFDDTNLLDQVFSFVGPGNWAFLQFNKFSSGSCCVEDRRTSFAAVFESPSRVRWGHGLGLCLSSQRQQRRAGSIASSIEVLVAAQNCGLLPWSSAVAEGCAEGGWPLCKHSTHCTAPFQRTSPMLQ
jgi:hypothetical protein